MRRTSEQPSQTLSYQTTALAADRTVLSHLELYSAHSKVLHCTRHPGERLGQNLGVLVARGNGIALGGGVGGEGVGEGRQKDMGKQGEEDVV